MGTRAWQAGRIGDAVRELAMALPLYAQTTAPLEGFYAESYLVAESFSIYNRAAHGTITIDEGAAEFERLIEGMGDPYATVTLCGFACTAAMGHGAWHHVRHFATITARIDPELQFGFWSGQNLMHRGVMLAYNGEVDEAIAVFADGMSRYSGIGGRSGLATFHAALAEVLAGRGRLAEAAQYAAEARSLLDADNELWNRTSVLVAEALVADGEGRRGEALETLARAAQMADEQEAFAVANRARQLAAALDAG
jgi:tetratricopeptide (TPR) repeat protein